MNDRPKANELVDVVRLFLEKELLPGLTDARLRFQTLVAANVLGIACRELSGEEAMLREEWRVLSTLLAESTPVPSSAKQREGQDRNDPSPQPPPRSGEGGQETESGSDETGRCCLPPPLRFGEGVGGRGSFIPSEFTATSELRQVVREMNERLCLLIQRGEFDETSRRRVLMDVVRRLVLRKLAVANPRYAAKDSGAT